MIDMLFQGGSLPVLERVAQFTSLRQRLLADDIANLSTPYYKPRDLNPRAFQAALGKAVDRRREEGDPASSPLKVQDTRRMRFRDGAITSRPDQSNEGILFHDQNNRDLERTMQHLAENTMVHNMAIDLIRSEMALLRTAIRERL